MAIKLQKYQRQVGATSGAGATQMVDPNAAIAPTRAMGKAFDYATDLGMKGVGAYVEKKQAAQFVSDQASYKKKLIELDTDIESATNDFLRNPDNKYEDIHDKVVAPMLEKFGGTIQDQGYGDRGTNYATNNWEVDGQKFIASSMARNEKRELSNMVENIKDGYFIASNTGNVEEMKTYEAELRNIAGDEVANNVVALGVYNKNVNELYTMTDPKDIAAFVDSNEAKRMEPQQYQQFRTLASNHTKQLTANKYAPAKKDAMSMHKKGQLTEGYIKKLGLPENEQNLLVQMLNDDISESYTKNLVITDDLIAEVDDFLDGNYTGFSENEYDNLLTKIQEAGLPASVKFDILLPIIEGQEDASVNAPFFTKQKNASAYEQGQSEILKQYRDAFNASNSGMSADVKMFGFGNGYKKIQQWMSDNKSDIKSGKIDQEQIKRVVRDAVAPAVSNRIKIEARKKQQRAIHGEIEVEEWKDGDTRTHPTTGITYTMKDGKWLK